MTVTDIWVNNKEIKVRSDFVRPFYHNEAAIDSEEFKILFEIASNCNDASYPDI